MKVKSINYIFHCSCGKQFIKELRMALTKKIKGKVVNVTDVKMVCPFCHINKTVKLIGTVDYFGEHNEHNKMNYMLKPVKVNDVWEYIPVSKAKIEENKSSMSWDEKQEQWKSDEELTVNVIREI